MRVFLTGATGWIGSAIARDLMDHGHEVTGLATSPAKAETLSGRGVTPLVGTLGDLDVLRQGASGADGIVHTAFGLDISRIGELAAEDRRAIETFGAVFAGSDRPIVVTSGFLNMTGGTTTEDDRPDVLPDFPRASEQTALALADRGLRASVVRNPRSVHGQGERHGFVPMLAAVARDRGVSAFVGEGGQRWPAVHRDDAARLYRLALEHGGQGEVFHAVAEEAVPFREIAEAIARQVGVPAVSLTRDEAGGHFGPLAVWVANDGPASSARTRRTLGWRPDGPVIVADIGRADYPG